MPAAPRPWRLARFGDYEVDLEAGELRKHELRIKLQFQPFQILTLLLDRPGRVVRREELQRLLWPNDTVVEFEHGINAAINRLREALSDSAEEPRYVETLPRRGYRFIAPVETVAATSPPPESPVRTPALQPEESTPAADLVGQTVSRFRVLERLGGGGMGVVYRAKDTQLGREVAIKFLPAELASDARALERFQREARAASALDHPNICSVYDLGEHAGQPFIVMPLLKGQTLKQRIAVRAGLTPPAGAQQAAPLPTEEIFDLAMQVTDALAAAHAKGIIHRDIKPANIFVSESGQAKVLDFGIAKLTGSASEGDRTTTLGQVTQEGVVLGTAAYMSPEQLRGEEFDSRTDLFSFGTVLYEMATGKQAFWGATPAMLTEAILHRDPEPLRRLNPEIPAKFEAIIAKALQKDRAKRYSTAGALREDLDTLAETRPSARSLVVSVCRILPWRLKTARQIALAVLALGLALAAIWLAILHTSPPLEPQWALIADFENQTGDEFFDVTARQLLMVAIEQSRFVMVFPRDRVRQTLREMQKPADARLDPPTAREICLRENLPTFITGEVVPAPGGYRVAVTAVDARSERTLAALAAPLPGKQQLWEVVDRLAADLRAKLGEQPSTVQRTRVPLQRATTGSLEALERFSRALDQQAAGRIDDALILMKSAVELDPDFALAYSRLAVYQHSSGMEEDSLASSERAYELRDHVSERERYLIEATFHRVRLDYESALQAYRALAVLYPKDSDAQASLAENYLFGDRLPEAIESMQRACNLAPRRLSLRSRLIEYLAQANRTDEALAEVQSARLRDDQGLTLDSAEATALLVKGDFVRARQILQSLHARGDEYQRTVSGLELAELTILEGRLEAAAKQLEADLANDVQRGSKPYAAMRRYWLARLYLITGEKTRALAHLEGLDAKGSPSPLQLHELRQAGVALAEMGEVFRGQHVLRQIQQLQARYPGNFTRAARVQVQGVLDMASHRQAEAQGNLEQARGLWGGVLGAWSLALYWQQRGDYAKALEFYQEVLARKGDVLAWEFPGMWVIAHYQAGRCQQSLGKAREAARLYSEFVQLWGAEASKLPQVMKAQEELKSLRPA